jgi:hypothetical protein
VERRIYLLLIVSASAAAACVASVAVSVAAALAHLSMLCSPVTECLTTLRASQ